MADAFGSSMASLRSRHVVTARASALYASHAASSDAPGVFSRMLRHLRR